MSKGPYQGGEERPRSSLTANPTPGVAPPIGRKLTNTKLLPESEGSVPHIRHPNPGTYTGGWAPNTWL